MNRLINFFTAVDRIFAAIIMWLLVAIVLGITFLIGTQVVLRNFFQSGIAWAEIAARHSILWVAFLGAMLATRSRQHVAIDILTRFIPRTPRNSVRILLDAFSATIAFLLAKTSLAFVLSEWEVGSQIFSDIPSWCFQAVIPFGFAMISLEYVIGIGLDIWRIAEGKKGHIAGRGRG